MNFMKIRKHHQERHVNIIARRSRFLKHGVLGYEMCEIEIKRIDIMS